MDEAHNKTDAIIEQFQKNAEYTYAIAEKKAKLKLDAYLHNARREDILQRKKYKDGEINKSEYIEWRKKKILYSKEYVNLINDLSKIYTMANAEVVSGVREYLLSIYAINHNFALDEVRRKLNA